jgi:flavodoxin
MRKIHPRINSLRLLLIAALTIAVVWTALTVWVEMPGKKESVTLGSETDSLRVLIVYDPDPIYNLDEQVCRGIAKGLIENHIQVVLATTKAAKLDLQNFESVVVCANTYNWAPDNAVMNFIEESTTIDGMDVVAITVGSGSTAEAREKLEKSLHAAGAKIILSKEWWLMRPNDESRMEEKNVDVAVDQAYHIGITLSDSIRNEVDVQSAR